MWGGLGRRAGCGLSRRQWQQACASIPRTPPRTPVPLQVIGTAIALLLLSGGAVPLWGGVLLAALSACLILFLERWGVRYLEVLFELLIAGKCVYM